MLYDPAISEKGALVCVARAPRKKSVEDLEAKPVVHNPHALPLFRDAPSRKRAREKARNDPVKSKRPDLPMSGPGFGGRVGTTKGSLLTQYLMRVRTLLVFLYAYWTLFLWKGYILDRCSKWGLILRYLSPFTKLSKNIHMHAVNVVNISASMILYDLLLVQPQAWL